MALNEIYLGTGEGFLFIIDEWDCVFRIAQDDLTLLVHLGYLTYDKTSRCVLIPNLEVKEEFLRAIKNGTGWDGLMRSLNRSAKLLQDTWDMNQEAVAAGIEEIHSETASLLKYN